MNRALQSLFYIDRAKKNNKCNRKCSTFTGQGTQFLLRCLGTGFIIDVLKRRKMKCMYCTCMQPKRQSRDNFIFLGIPNNLSFCLKLHPCLFLSGAVLYYYFYKRTALRLGDPRFYKDSQWLRQEFARTH